MMSVRYLEGFCNWITVFIEAVDIETGLTVFSDRYVIIDSYGFISAVNLYFLSNFLGDKIYGITGFSIGEKSEVTIVRFLDIDGSLSGGRNKTFSICKLK